MESMLKDVGTNATVGGGVQDAYGEDCATEDQPVTPWTVSVVSGYSLLRDPHHNKRHAFTEKERDVHHLDGPLPPAVVTEQLEKRNERLFYKLLIDNVEELFPIVYTPTVGEACQKYGIIFRRLYISLKEKGKILVVLKNWPEHSIQVIVVTDGEGEFWDLGILAASVCIEPIDVGTNNEQLLKDEFYIELRQRRAIGKEYADLLHEFRTAVKQNYGEKVLIQVSINDYILSLKVLGSLNRHFE